MRPAEAGRAGVATTVLRVRRPIRLAQDDISRLVRIGNPIAPAEYPAVSGVGDPERRTDDGDTERPIHARRRAPAAAVGFDRSEVGLADDDVGCGIAGLRHGVPYQDPVVPGVGDNQSPVMDQHPGRQVHAALRAASTGAVSLRLTVRLAKHHIGGLFVVVGDPVPDQHPMITGVGDHDVVVAPRNAQEHSARRIHPRHRRFRGRQCQTAGCRSAQPDLRHPAIGQIDRRDHILAAAKAADVVPHGVSAHQAVITVRHGPRRHRHRSAAATVPAERPAH